MHKNIFSDRFIELQPEFIGGKRFDVMYTNMSHMKHGSSFCIKSGMIHVLCGMGVKSETEIQPGPTPLARCCNELVSCRDQQRDEEVNADKEAIE
ncbi:hypothetical protein KSZ_35830 [Dictyobacter formicarum]|uniref:Uncharacterized protein n=1 Tax=Dictyobacter formicarum TaxID=2778368 RepID=A0ABQ3VHC0_9CHLR|nr:hypothetical protein KSZ_35830 [Dictyobacter formicarum]